jgi:hypothetical protein
MAQATSSERHEPVERDGPRRYKGSGGEGIDDGRPLGSYAALSGTFVGAFGGMLQHLHRWLRARG